ncbi:hypothetical protein BDB00DRAFT_883407 [Zychaea mexicana]|uniref:uncharacterized protein n=1 Tax=Zychaea mexicana TaxID=64656 RepID=UPI0022FDEF90|nr:uncharacterized protein BDB00DRAFT_883407 [Zychaea mexicana]KAI9492658.1 hypothetical protein BDB00DRAFT_883407 [Zychaea mexicana]
MGIGLDSPSSGGIVPRFIDSLFGELAKRQTSPEVYVSFLELYNEDLVDLLNPAVKRGEGLHVSIREDAQGNICWMGVREEPVASPRELLELLQKGSIARTTASTDMNRSSSRSHAIFSVILKQSMDDGSRLTSKFHFVDLAGSERLKRTNAVGDRAKEGISINTGLLALGNVISALGDESRKVSHIPYRDSKLTRLLQDSLGGNSQTLMLACVSPADSNYTETLNTLKYANRARNIRNRVVVNQEFNGADPACVEKLKAQIIRLKEELRGNDEFLHAVNDEMDTLKTEVVAMNGTLSQMTNELACTKYERDRLKKLVEQNYDPASYGAVADAVQDVEDSLVSEYCQTIEKLRAENETLKQQQHQQQHQQQQHQRRMSKSEEDDLATLVGSSTSHEVAVPAATAEKTPKAKKRHSYRFGSKRSVRGRRRLSVNHSPKNQRTSSMNNVWKSIEQAKASLAEETTFLKSAENPWVRGVSAPPTPEDDGLLSNDPRILSFADSFGSVLPIYEPCRNNKNNINNNMKKGNGLRRSSKDHHDNTLLLTKLQTCVNGKQQLVQLLEKCESQRMEQVQQYEAKLADAQAKKKEAQVQFRRDMSEQKSQYESRIKKLSTELSVLKRKHAQTLTSAESARTKSNAVILSLKSKLDKANQEKKKMTKRIKQDSDRTRERCSSYEREITKLKRNETQAVAARKRIERDVSMHKATAKRATEEMAMLSGQMKQVALLLKKILTCGKLDRQVLTKAMACASVRGCIVRQSLNKRGSFKLASLQQRVFQKKRLIHRALALHIKSCHKEMQDLCQKRDRLQCEQKELLAERELVLDGDDPAEPQYMDDRIDTITLELDYLDFQINQLQQSPEWSDVVDKELQIDLADPETNSQVAYQVALSLVRSLEPDEARLVSEALMDEVIELRKLQSTSVMARSSDIVVQKAQQALVTMRREPSDLVLLKALQGPVHISNGLLLPSTC